LLLTTLDPVRDQSGQFIGTSGNISLRGTAGSQAAVVVQQGARINALSEGSYVGLIAPRVDQAGSIRVNGSAGLIMAESVDLVINNGLFDITVNTGTSVANPLSHTGSTGGPASTSATDNHRVYMVAVPKNQALTMVLQGSVGFDAATSAAVQNGQIILSSGRSVRETTTGLSVPGGTTASNLIIGPGTFTSNVRAFANTDVFAIANSAASSFAGDLSLLSFGGRSHVGASDGRTLTIGGNVSVGSFGFATESLLFARSGGTVNVAGSASVDSSVQTSGRNSQGGSARIEANGGTIRVTGAARISASASASATSADSTSFSGTGGTASLSATNNGSVSVTGITTISAQGQGGAGPVANTAGGAGKGGSARAFATSGGTLTVGVVEVNADGTGGAGTGTGAGGTGTGGLAVIFTEDGRVNFGNASLSASGRGGNGATGGDGIGGFTPGDQTILTTGAAVSARRGTITGTSVTITSSGNGGAGSSGAGGKGIGGVTFVTGFGDTAASTVDIDTVVLNARGSGGAGGPGAAGGAAQGGSAIVTAQAVNGRIISDRTTLNVSAAGGAGGAGRSNSSGPGEAGGAGGAAYGGFINVGTASGGNASTATTFNGSASLGVVVADSSATGGSGGAGGTGSEGSTAGAGGAGGVGVGGDVALLARGSALNASQAQLIANGTGGQGGLQGGSTTVRGNSGVGVGGGAGLLATNVFEGTAPATVNVTSLTARAAGIAAGGTGPSQTGNVFLDVQNSSATIGTLSLTASGSSPRQFTGTAPNGTAVNRTNVPSLVNAANASVTVTGAASISTPQNLNISAAGPGIFNVRGGLLANAGGTIAVSHSTPGATSTVTGPQLSFTSGDINIGSGANIGNESTEAVTLAATNTGRQAVLFGTTQGPGYTLTAEEASRVEARSITFNVAAQGLASGVPDLVVRDFTATGADLGAVRQVNVATPGFLQVEGAVRLTNVPADLTISVTGSRRLEVITPGGITLSDANGRPAGTLRLLGGDIVVTSRALADRLRADPNFSGREEALRTNDGPVNAAGYIQAGGVQLLAGTNIFVQNTGTATEFAGVTVGGGGLLVGRMTAQPNPSGGTNFSFVGTLATENDVLFFDFTINAESTVTLLTYSYAGGTNSAGQVIPSGGFDPILALFNAAGALIAQNDDGGENVPADPTTGSRFDTFLRQTLAAGTYRVAVSAFSNFARGPNLSDGFRGGGSFGGRTPNFAFDVRGANS
ncbi:MAG: DVUA0089 family protein, partial [Pseudomonadota bacterium]|nr:DVUA0089 family protein [Pseudomonadota bacterium]